MKRLLPWLLLVVLLGAVAGGGWWWNQPPQRLARLKQQTGQAFLKKDKPALKAALKEADRFLKDFEKTATDAQQKEVRLLALDIARRGLGDKKELLSRLEDFRSRHAKDPLADVLLAEEADLLWKFKKQPMKALKRISLRLARPPLPKDDALGELWFKMGQLNDALGEFDDAADAYQQLVDDLPSHKRADEALFRLGEIYATRLDREEEARKAFEKLAEKSPDTELGREAGDRARELKEYQGGGGGNESRQMTVVMQQSADAALRKILKQPKKITWVHTRVRLGKMSLAVSGSLGVEITGPVKDTLEFLYNDRFRLVRLALDGKEMKPKAQGQMLSIPLRGPLKKGDTLTLSWQGRLSLRPPDGPMGKVARLRGVPVGGLGLVSPKEGYLTATDMWTPTLDYDGLMDIVTDVDFPAPLQAVAAGRLVREETRRGRYRARWVMPVKHGHNSLCYGQFSVSRRGPYTTYLSAKDAAAAPGLLTMTERAMKFYAGLYGPSRYPVVKICQINSPVFKGYAEATLVMLGGREAVRAKGTGVLAHELAHQWWGNQVSLSLIKDTPPWLWEGFASYADVLFQEHEQGKVVAKRRLALMATRYFHDLLRYGDVPILENSFENPSYLGVVYQKGAWVLHMLRHELTPALFERSMRNYAITHSARSVTLDSLRASLKKITGRDQSPFLNQWLKRTGYLRLEAQGLTLAGGRLSGALVQPGPAYHQKVSLLLRHKAQQVRHSLALNAENTGLSVPVSFQASELVIDPDDWLLKQPGDSNVVKITTAVP